MSSCVLSPVKPKLSIKCAIGCRGDACPRCGRLAYTKCVNFAFKGLHSNWVTDDIVASQRPFDWMFDDKEFDLMQQFKDRGIGAIFNLTEPGEHSHCGSGKVLEAGFTYTPEKVMTAGIKYFNFSWKDMTAPSLEDALPILRTAVTELERESKIFVHCHAGLGRTGLIIACVLVARDRITADEAIEKVRANRPRALQTTSQMSFVREFAQQVRAGTVVVEPLLVSPRAKAPQVMWDESRVSPRLG